MEQKTESLTTTTPIWIKPTLEIVGVSLECTAYAGASEAKA